MNCKDCEKSLKGGFKQPDGLFLCARCVIVKTERSCLISAAKEALKILDSQLNSRKRPTKTDLREARGWIAAITTLSSETYFARRIPS